MLRLTTQQFHTGAEKNRFSHFELFFIANNFTGINIFMKLAILYNYYYFFERIIINPKSKNLTRPSQR